MAQEHSRASTAGTAGSEVRARTEPGAGGVEAAPQNPLGEPPATQRPGGTTRVTMASPRENMLVLGADGETVGMVDSPAPQETVMLKPDTFGQRHWLPLAWIARVDDQAHVDRAGMRARQEWLAEEPAAESADRA